MFGSLKVANLQGACTLLPAPGTGLDIIPAVSLSRRDWHPPVQAFCHHLQDCQVDGSRQGRQGLSPSKDCQRPVDIVPRSHHLVGRWWL